MTMGKSAEVERLSVFGLGKLGSVVAGCHAARGFFVVGFDPSERTVASVRQGIAPVEEPRLQELFDLSRGRLEATDDARRAVRESQATMIVVPTPSIGDGRYSLDHVESACRSIGEALREKDDYHLVVLKSTVLPGDSHEVIVPALEEASGKRCGVDFGYCYNPEFIALGSVVRNILEPDLVLIGETDPRAGELLEGIYRRLHDGESRPTARMTPANAEVTKLAVNTYVTLKITYANALAQVCERLPEGDAGVVSQALGLDSRIGGRYLQGGLGFGGPCFPRDNKALLAVAQRLGVPFDLAATTDASNAGFTTRVVDVIADRLRPGSEVAVLGLSYKPSTPVIDESQAVVLTRMLGERGYGVRVYDPLAMDNARQVLGDDVKYAESARACIENADAAVIATAWPEFANLDLALLRNGLEAPVFDCWGVLRAERERLPNLWLLGVADDELAPRADSPTRARSSALPTPPGPHARL